MSAPQVSIDKGVATIRTDAFSFVSDSPAQGLSRIDFDDGLRMETRHAVLGKMSESVAVHEKRRLNSSRDGEELSFVMRAVIPFGAEPAVEREVSISESLIRFETEIALRNSFALESLSSESFAVGGPIARIGVVAPPKRGAASPEPEWHDFASFERLELELPPLSLLIETPSGSFLEISYGEDLWRWASARRHGGSCSFVLSREAGGLRFDVQLFKLNPDASPAKGWNWRFSWFASWSKGKPAKSRKRKFKASFDLDDFAWPESAFCVVHGKPSKRPCPSSPAVLNALKKWLRSQLSELSSGDTLAVLNADASYCESPSHQDRPKLDSLPHWGLEPLIEFREWASRQLEPSGAKLLILPRPGSNAAALPSFASLSK